MGGKSPNNSHFHVGIRAPCGSLGSREFTCQVANAISIKPYSRLFRAHSPWSLYSTMGHPITVQKLSLPLGRSGPPSNKWLLGPNQAYIPNCTSIGSAVFAGHSVMGTQTDHATTCVYSNRLHVYTMHTMRPKNHCKLGRI